MSQELTPYGHEQTVVASAVVDQRLSSSAVMSEALPALASAVLEQLQELFTRWRAR